MYRETRKILHKCGLCNSEYEYGFGKYNGRPLKLYGYLSCCDTCWNSNWDGWAPHYEEKLLNFLKEKKLPIPARNSKGWLPRDENNLE